MIFMFKRLTLALTALLTLIWSVSSVEAAKPDKWLIYWYVCGTDIETTRIAFSNGTNLMSDNPNDLGLAEPDRSPGDVTRCIKEVEKAVLSPNVKIFMQAGGTYIWGHPKFRDLNAKIETKVVVYNKDENGKLSPVEGIALFNNDPKKTGSNTSVSQWSLTGGGGYTAAKPVLGGNGKLGRYVYDKNHRNWYPREQLPIPNDPNNGAGTKTDMGSKAGLVSFLKAGQKLEKELYPDGNVRRVLIFVDHGSGINGICIDEYTKNELSLQEINAAFKEVNNGWMNPEEKPFEVVAFDACIMSVYETALAVEDFANYMVASQESTIGKVMFGYTDLLNNLSKNPLMSGKELGKVICNTTWEDSKITDKEFGLNSNVVFTESVIDLSKQKMDALKTAYANFSEEALNVARQNPDDVVYTFAKFKNAANVSDRFSIIGGGTPDMVDLKNFAANVRDTFPELKKVGNELVKAIDNSVVYNKRGSAFKRGGGISIYYPFDVISVEGREKSYDNFKLTVKNKLSPENPGKLYEYLLEGVTKELNLVNEFDKNTGKPLYYTDTKKPVRKYEISDDSIFNLKELRDTEVKLDEDKKTATIELDEEQQKGVESVRYMLMSLVPRKDDPDKMDAFILGKDSDIKENREIGTFELNFNKKWVTLDGVPLYFLVVSDATRKDKNGKKVSGSDICVSDVLLNGERYKLFFSRSYPNEKVTLIGLVENKDIQLILKSVSDTGQIPNISQLPSGDLQGLKKGDIVTPLFTYVDSEKIENAAENSKSVEDMTDKEKIIFSLNNVVSVPIKSITIGDKPKFEIKALHNGVFAYVFEFVNPLGDRQNVFTKDGVVCKIKNGKIVKMKHFNEVDYLSDLDD